VTAAPLPLRRVRELAPPNLAVALFAAGLVVLLLLALADILQGTAGLSSRTVLDALVSPDGSVQHELVRNVRLPRAAAGIIAGCCLAAAGVCFQAVTRNPLAEPGTVGINAGATLAIAITLAFVPIHLGSFTIVVAFVGAIAAALLVWGIASLIGMTPLRLVLAGMAVTLVLASVTAAIELVRENATAGLFFWGAGSLVQDGWSSPRLTAILGAAGILVALGIGRSIDVSLLGDDQAGALGLRAKRMRLGAGLLGAFLAAVAVTVVGPFAFVGFVAPHFARLAGVRKTVPLILVSSVLGGCLILAADVLTRIVLGGSGGEVPAGVFTALLGTPVLIALARGLRGDLEIGVSAPGTSVGRSPSLLTYPLIAVLLVASMIAGLAWGDLELGPAEVVRALVSSGDPLTELVVNLRWPRVVAAALSGACLGVSGAVLQGVVRNPLAGPEIVGVTGGASAAAVSVLVLYPGLGADAVPPAALVGGIVVLGAVLVASGGLRATPARLALVGLGVSAACAGFVSLMAAQASVRVTLAVQWLAGTTYGRTEADVLRILVPAAILLPIAWAFARRIDVLGLGDDAAHSLGMHVGLTRTLLLGLGAALGSIAVATVGAVAFVGLLGPHAARLLSGGANRRVVPMTALLGALLVTVADVLGRSVFAPHEIPTGVVVALLGAPYLCAVLWFSRRTAT
jgi:ferric hydroxamate transport system permease protein